MRPASRPEAERAIETRSTKPQRIIFLDLLRATAVVLMVQWHTMDVLLAESYRSYDYMGFRLWQFVRGMTAPIFLLTTGMAFIYLLRSSKTPLREHPRLIKGIKRSLLLLSIGYLLRFPSSSLLGIFDVQGEYWKTFWVVDVLQLVGIGLLILLAGSWLSEKSGGRDPAVFGAGALVFYLCAPFTEQVNWNALLPAPLAAYIYSGSGSLFPLFPWAGYILCGGVLGAYITRERMAPTPSLLSRKLIEAAWLLFALYAAALQFKAANVGSSDFWASNPELVLLRLGAVFLLTALIAMISMRLRTIPPTMLLLGRHTLLIYVAHLVMLYGSPWNSGVNQLCHKCLSLRPTLYAALLMQAIVIGLAIAYSKIHLSIGWFNFISPKKTV